MADNLRVIEETVDICDRGFYNVGDKRVDLILSREQMENAVVYTAEQIGNLVEEFTCGDSANTSCELYNIGSFEAAEKIKEEKVLVLNFANPIHPGGGVRHGANAQEEDLCRKSTLLLSLEGEKAESYYKFHRKRNFHLSSDSMIISPTVEVFRNGDNTLTERPFVVSVLTCAAPIMSVEAISMGQEKYEELLYHRIKGMLCLAAKEGYKNIVLGAWGCGAFGNDAEVMARLFDIALKEVKKFDKVVMAVLDRSRAKYNFKAFEKRF